MKMTFISKNLLLGLCVASAGIFSACSDSDNNSEGEEGGNNGNTKMGPYFVSVSGESSEYIMQLENVESGKVKITENIKQLEQAGYTWIFSDDHKHAIGLIYRQGDPGVGLGYQATPKGKFEEKGQFQISSRFTTYGFFDNLALTAVGGQTPVDKDGNALTDEQGNPRKDGVTFNMIELDKNLKKSEKTILTLDQFKKGELATLSGIVDAGNGTFLTGLVVSKPRDPNATGGSSNGEITEPNKVWVAALDKNFNIKHVYQDERISYSAGRYRSQYYSQIGIADSGDVYVFSGSYDEATTLPAGALKISKGAKEFNKDYYFNIQEKSDNFRFRKVWHISGDYFLLEFYNIHDIETLTPATQYGIVNMKAKSFSWVKGLPEKDKITNTGIPAAHDGKIAFPITAEGANPTIYNIDPATAQATAGVQIIGAKEIRAVGYLAN